MGDAKTVRAHFMGLAMAAKKTGKDAKATIQAMKDMCSTISTVMDDDTDNEELNNFTKEYQIALSALCENIKQGQEPSKEQIKKRIDDITSKYKLTGEVLQGVAGTMLGISGCMAAKYGNAAKNTWSAATHRFRVMNPEMELSYFNEDGDNVQRDQIRGLRKHFARVNKNSHHRGESFLQKSNSTQGVRRVGGCCPGCL